VVPCRCQLFLSISQKVEKVQKKRCFQVNC
jgi:hypothetical protein